MRKLLSFLIIALLMWGCGNSAETKPPTDAVDSGIEVTFGLDSMDDADTRGVGPGGLQPKSDTLNNNLKVNFPDKKN